MHVRVKDSLGEFFEIMLYGFEPNEAIIIISKSCDELLSGTEKANSDGSVSVLISPAVIGKKGGPFTFTVKSLSGDTLVFDHFWGFAAFKPYAGPVDQ